MKLSRSNHRMSAERIRWVVGCMTGTSLDGLDGALMEIRGSGLCITARFKGLISCPLGDLREPLLEMSRGRDTTPSRIMRTARQLGDLHAATVTDLCAGQSAQRGAAKRTKLLFIARVLVASAEPNHAHQSEAKGCISQEFHDPVSSV